jgi:hypothetical protein
MPRAKKAAVVEEAETEKDYTVYAEKDPTDSQERFADWLLDKVDPDIEGEDDFRKGVYLAKALMQEFQKSPENQEALAARKERVEQEKAAKAAAPPRKRGRPAKAKVEEPEVESDDDDSEEAPAPAPKTRARATRAKSATAKTATAKPTRTARARKTVKAVATNDDAPF